MAIPNPTAINPETMDDNLQMAGKSMKSKPIAISAPPMSRQIRRVAISSSSKSPRLTSLLRTAASIWETRLDRYSRDLKRSVLARKEIRCLQSFFPKKSSLSNSCLVIVVLMLNNGVVLYCLRLSQVSF